jgi:glycine C-acetyltransferase
MYGKIKHELKEELEEIRSSGLYKPERVIETPQSARVQVGEGSPVLNLCANNYLGLANHPEVVEAAHKALDKWGYGMASVRFICGTQSLHKELEARLSIFLGTEETILYSSCFDANTGLFETILSKEDAIFSDALNHASIIDGVRLCKAQRFRYGNNNMEELRNQLVDSSGARRKLIVTDGVFSMDGYLADLPSLCELAEEHQALLMVDDSHAVGFMGKNGRGTHEYHGVIDQVDLITGTLGKALGGASGGYISGRKEIIEFLRQRSRPYLFSNTLAPVIAAGSLKALDLLESTTELRDRLEENTHFFRKAMEHEGFEILPGEHPIIPVMFGEAAKASQFADLLLKKGIYVIPFSYPVVPQGEARIRIQVSAVHTKKDLAFTVEKFAEVRRENNS